MKNLALICAICVSSFGYSQSFGGGKNPSSSNNGACLQPEERAEIISQLKKSSAKLKANNNLLERSIESTHPLFIWPVKKASHVTYEEVWAISNYVDHNANYPDQITDYNGGTKSYDSNSGYNHQGLDIYTWPYNWSLVQGNSVEVIAAAEGQIIYKNDGQSDQSCSLNGSSWNAVYIKHSDGSVAWYGHMKNGSLTTKSVGEMVAQGEFLGVVASSGNSSGPHLHFEVYEDDSYSLSKLIDPYAGPSNQMNAESWWADQKPYKNPAINALTTNSAAPNFGTCPEVETTNEKNHFNLYETATFIVFLKDQLGESFNLKIYKPNNSVAYNWNKNLTADYSSSYWYYSGVVDVDGEWKAECTLSTGQVVTHYFTVGSLVSTNNITPNDINVYPNPVKNQIHISSQNTINQIVLTDILGNIVLEKQDLSGISTIDSKSLSAGVYILTTRSDTNEIKTVKILKK